MKKNCLYEINSKGWYEFNNQVIGADMKIFLFGSSSSCDKFHENYSTKYTIEGIIDNNKEKWGKLYNNKVAINGPSHLLNYNKDKLVVLITSGYSLEIAQQLYNLGYEHVYSYHHMQLAAAWKPNSTDKSNIAKLKELMFDDFSKKVIDAIIQKRSIGSSSFEDINEKNQYFRSDIFNVIADEVFIDAGAYDGKTIEDFIAWTGNNYKKIYSFEMNKESMPIIKNKLKEINDDKVVLYNYGVWNKNETVYYSSNGPGSKLSEEKSEEYAECRTLDSLIEESVTFIKMDIEGAEAEAIEGASMIIKRDKPKLAICLYHKKDDLWELPFLIKSLVPEYKFYIRHHSPVSWETVLYATL